MNASLAALQQPGMLEKLPCAFPFLGYPTKHRLQEVNDSCLVLDVEIFRSLFEGERDNGRVNLPFS